MYAEPTTTPTVRIWIRTSAERLHPEHILDAASRELLADHGPPDVSIVGLRTYAGGDERAVNDPPEPSPRAGESSTSTGYAWLLAEASTHHDPADHGWSRDW